MSKLLFVLWFHVPLPSLVLQPACRFDVCMHACIVCCLFTHPKCSGFMAAKYAVCQSDSGGLEVAEKRIGRLMVWIPGPTEDLGGGKNGLCLDPSWPLKVLTAPWAPQCGSYYVEWVKCRKSIFLTSCIPDTSRLDCQNQEVTCVWEWQEWLGQSLSCGMWWMLQT